jgi:hypothetical protein
MPQKELQEMKKVLSRQARWHLCMLRRLWLSVFAFATLAAAPAQAEPVYFVVAEPADSIVHGDSYVLPLTDPAEIAGARQIIADGTQIIVFAAIAPGSDGINRDVT